MMYCLLGLPCPEHPMNITVMGLHRPPPTTHDPSTPAGSARGIGTMGWIPLMTPQVLQVLTKQIRHIFFSEKKTASLSGLWCTLWQLLCERAWDAWECTGGVVCSSYTWTFGLDCHLLHGLTCGIVRMLDKVCCILIERQCMTWLELSSFLSVSFSVFLTHFPDTCILIYHFQIV